MNGQKRSERRRTTGGKVAAESVQTLTLAPKKQGIFIPCARRVSCLLPDWNGTIIFQSPNLPGFVMVPPSQDKTVRLRCFEVIGFFLGDDHPDRFLFVRSGPDWSQRERKGPVVLDSVINSPTSCRNGNQLHQALRPVSCEWWSRVESNHHLRLRRPSSYPLDHGTSRGSR